MTQTHEIKINGKTVDYSFDALGYRLNRFALSASNFAQRGGDFSSNIVFPATKNNIKVFGKTSHLSGINKFNFVKYFTAEIFVGGAKIFNGKFKLEAITKEEYEGVMFAEDVSWIQLLENISLQDIGRVEGVPSWTTPFVGGFTINSSNEKNNAETDIICPTLIYNNTLLSDKMDFTNTAITGTYDANGNVEVEPLDFPSAYQLRHAYFGYRQGLTFEDFPPAVYYSNLLRKMFTNIGWNITGEIFQEDWFKKLYMPYVGSVPYQYNWRTMAHLHAEPELRTTVQSSPVLVGDYVIPTPISTIWPTLGTVNTWYAYQQIGQDDSVVNRVDFAANFKKFMVTDDTAEYICPADGRYKLKLNSTITKVLEPLTIGLYNVLDLYRDVWEDNVLVIYRKNEAGDFALNPDSFNNLQEWANGDRVNFVNEPSDIIACLNVAKYMTLGATDATVGSPLTLNQEPVTVNSASHSNSVDPVLYTVTSTSAAEFEIEMDMLTNERIGFVWVALSNFKVGASGTINIRNSTIATNNGDSLIEVDYLCGVADLDIALNLPAMSCKDFMTSFINQFNLAYTVNEEGKTVTVSYAPTFYGTNPTSYNIDKIVDVRSVVIKPTRPPKKLTVGYTVDDRDRLLNSVVSACVSDTIEVNEYANVFVQENDNIYAEGELNITNVFSPTKFSYSRFELVNPFFDVPTLFQYTDSYTLVTADKGIVWSPPYTLLRYGIPSIQSQESFDAEGFDDLTYNYDYQPRLLYHLGTANTFYGLAQGLQIRINAPAWDSRYEPEHYVRATVSAFDAENGNTLRTLRYDGLLGLYNTYFENTIDTLNKTHIVECDAYLNITDWINLKANRLIEYQDDLYKLLEISDYDVTGENPSKLTMIKVL